MNQKNDLDIILNKMKGKETQGEIDTQYMDYEKVNKFFDWSPEHSFDEGLDKTIEWFTAYLKTINKY